MWFFLVAFYLVYIVYRLEKIDSTLKKIYIILCNLPVSEKKEVDNLLKSIRDNIIKK